MYNKLYGGGFLYCSISKDTRLNRPFGDPCAGARFEWSGMFNPGRRVTLLSRVCRQMHQETSLLIFELNLFSFYDRGEMLRWLKTLKPLQRRSMRSICLPLPYEAVTKTHRKQLSGLKEIFYNAATKRVRCTIYDTSEIQKIMSISEPYTWARVEDDSDAV